MSFVLEDMKRWKECIAIHKEKALLEHHDSMPKLAGAMEGMVELLDQKMAIWIEYMEHEGADN